MKQIKTRVLNVPNVPRVNECRAHKGFMHHNPKKGRTTALICNATNETLAEYSGDLTLSECYRNYLDSISRIEGIRDNRTERINPRRRKQY